MAALRAARAARAARLVATLPRGHAPHEAPLDAPATMSRLARGVGRATELVMRRGAGSRVETACGQSMLDFTCGIGVTNTGHCHPRVVEAAQAQCGKLIHGQVNIGWHEVGRPWSALRFPPPP